MNNLSTKMFMGVAAHYRQGTACEPSSDEDSLDEVVTNRCYRLSPDFDVETGERWLDLGANIGAFAIYCRARGAIAECYEPLMENFYVLERNIGVGFTCYPYAVSARTEAVLKMVGSPNPTNKWRGTICVDDVPPRYVSVGTIRNKHASFLCTQSFDGVKMDIEGAEGGILDQWLMPKCNKLVLEYHTSRDNSVQHLHDRIAALQIFFKQVRIPPEYEYALHSSNATVDLDRDKLIFCWEPRS